MLLFAEFLCTCQLHYKPNSKQKFTRRTNATQLWTSSDRYFFSLFQKFRYVVVNCVPHLRYVLWKWSQPYAYMRLNIFMSASFTLTLVEINFLEWNCSLGMAQYEVL